jgi:hypothetical protein
VECIRVIKIVLERSAHGMEFISHEYLLYGALYTPKVGRAEENKIF